jgi:hypothetical protein
MGTPWHTPTPYPSPTPYEARDSTPANRFDEMTFATECERRNASPDEGRKWVDGYPVFSPDGKHTVTAKNEDGAPGLVVKYLQLPVKRNGDNDALWVTRSRSGAPGPVSWRLRLQPT